MKVTRAFADGITQLDALSNVRAFITEKGGDPGIWAWEFSVVPAPFCATPKGRPVTWRAEATFTR